MSKLLPCVFALLLVAVAVPAVADSAAAPAPAALQADQLSEIMTPAPIFMQNGPPDEWPGNGNACRIPPPFQPESCICPLIFDPVCGCNNETYSNACFAACEVRSFTEGACE